jgi:CheY-like chemotaxis protein
MVATKSPNDPNEDAEGAGPPALTSDGRQLSLTNGAQPIVILLVDDDPDCRMLIRDAVAECKMNNDIYEVSNGQEAMDFLRRCPPFQDAPRPGLVYLDIEMPGMNGQEVLKRIKSDPALRDIPVVMMTGVSDEEQMRQAASNGANSYTIKPASAEEFLRTVLSSTNYWLTVHQHPGHQPAPEECRKSGLV